MTSDTFRTILNATHEVVFVYLQDKFHLGRKATVTWINAPAGLAEIEFFDDIPNMIVVAQDIDFTEAQFNQLREMGKL